MFPVWFVLFNVYLHSPFTTTIIFDSLLEDLNGTTILTENRCKCAFKIKMEGGALKCKKNWGISCNNNNCQVVGEHRPLKKTSLNNKISIWYCNVNVQ